MPDVEITPDASRSRPVEGAQTVHSRVLEEAHVEFARVREVLDKRTAELEQARSALDSRSAELTGARMRFAGQLSELQSAAAGREAGAADEFIASDTLLDEVARLETWKEKVPTHLEAKVAKLSAQLDAERQEREVLGAAHQQAMQALRLDLEREQAEHDSLPANFEQELQALEVRYRLLSDEMRRVQSVADAARRRSGMLQAELKAALQSVGELKARDEEAAETRSALHSARSQLQTMGQALQQEAAQRRRAEAQVEDLESEMVAVRHDCTDAKREIELLRGERAAVLSSRTWRLAKVPHRVINVWRRG